MGSPRLFPVSLTPLMLAALLDYRLTLAVYGL
jgi:hypothetical protein